MPIRYHWYLIDVLAAHQLKRLDRRCLRLLRNLTLLIDVTFSTPTTNFDNRSFGINDEVNLAVLDPAVAARLTENFEEDISHSRRITLKEWNRRSLYERSLESIDWFLERQQ